MAKPTTNNPYLSQRRVYSDVIENAVNTANTWKTYCFVLFVCLLASVAANVYQGTLTRVKPVVIEVDGHGIPSKLYSVDGSVNKRDGLVAKAALARVIKGVRGVSVDADVTKRELNEINFFFKNTSSAHTVIARYIRDPETNPFVRAKRMTVDIKISNVVKVTDKSWQVDWLETEYNRQGKQNSSPKFMRAVATISYVDQISAKMAIVNPLGLVIDDLTWNERIN